MGRRASTPTRSRDRLERLERAEFWDPAVGAGLLAGRRFDRILRDMLPTTAIRACRVPVKISVFDIVRRATAVLDDGDLAHAIRASCAVPALFHPVWIARRAYWDGGILDRPGLAGIAGERSRAVPSHRVEVAVAREARRARAAPAWSRS